MPETATTTTCAMGCRWAGHHRTDCPGDPCAGCMGKPALEGLHVCEWHHRRAAELFADARHVGSLLWVRDWLATNRGQHIKGQALTQHVTGTMELPTPLVLDVHDLLMRITDLVWSWERALRDEFDRPEPREAFTLEAGVLFLRSWWPRLEEADRLVLVLADAWEEFAELLRDCHTRAPWRQGVRPVRGVPCPYCAAPSLVVFDGDDYVTCRTCQGWVHRDTYREHVADLADRQQEAQTIAQMARLFDVPAKTLYDWKREGKISPIGDLPGKRDQLYRVADVSETVERMRRGA